jgi:hypothetical protein
MGEMDGSNEKSNNGHWADENIKCAYGEEMRLGWRPDRNALGSEATRRRITPSAKA